MGAKIRVAGIVKESIVDGPGIRLVVFTQGCKHNCEGCHNPHTHTFDGGYLVDVDSIVESVQENPMLDGITLSGGEPFEQASQLAELAEKVKGQGLNVMAYTGYKFEQLVQNNDAANGYQKLLKFTDTLVDGRFDLKRKNLLLKFRGSENQRILDVKRSIELNEAVEKEL